MDNETTAPDISGLVIRPTNQEKFRASMGRQILEEVLVENLAGQSFESSSAEQLSNSLATTIRNRLKGLNLPRYKYVVQVILGEERGQGVRAKCACMWDSDTDFVAHHFYSNDHLFCEATIFAVFHY